MNKENIAKSAIGVTIVMIIGYFLSFGKEALVAYYFGVSPEVDAYTIAIQVPVVLFSFVAVAIQSVIVPLYSDILYNQSREKTICLPAISSLLSRCLSCCSLFWVRYSRAD